MRLKVGHRLFSSSIKRTILGFRLINIILAILVFTSSSGFVINQHFCQGELKNTAFVVKAKTCHDSNTSKHEAAGHSKMPPNCPMHQSKGPVPCDEKKDCCNDKSEFVKLDIDQEITSMELLEIKKPVCSAIEIFPDSFNQEDPETYPIHYLNYKPPLIVCDLPVSLQTFLL